MQTTGDRTQQVNIELRHEISGEPELKKAKSYLILDSEMLPDIKDWKIGENYEVRLVVQQISLGQDDRISALEYDRNKVVAKFEVVKAVEAEEE
jgi:hypothetical protein